MKFICICLVGSVFAAQMIADEPAKVRNDDITRITFTDIDGGQHFLPCKDDLKCTVFVFINTECPIANAYHPTLTRLKEELAASKYDFVMIHADTSVTRDAAKKHRQDYNITWSVALDPGNLIARRLGAKVTPEAIVIDASGKVVYRGRIDDRHQDYGRKRPAPTTHDLHNALVAVRDNRPIALSETKAVGCIIRYSEPVTPH